MIADGMKNGEIFRGPPSRRARCSRSIVVNPPMPDAMNTPIRGATSGVTCSPESSTANCDAAIAYWMKTSIFLTSFFSIQRSGSNPRTSPAICVANCVASNLVIAPMPLLPLMSAFQFASVPIPSDDTRPMPVTTTRRLLTILLCEVPAVGRWVAFPVTVPRRLLLGLGVRVDVLDRFLDARDLLGVLVGNLDPELLLERHDQLHGVERVGAKIVDERRVRRHFFFVHPELLHDDALDFVGYRHSLLLTNANVNLVIWSFGHLVIDLVIWSF